MRQHSYFGVTHCEKLEVQTAAFSKMKHATGMETCTKKWKLVQRFTFCLSSTQCK